MATAVRNVIKTQMWEFTYACTDVRKSPLSIDFNAGLEAFVVIIIIISYILNGFLVRDIYLVVVVAVQEEIMGILGFSP